MLECLKCKNTHDGLFGSGKYCSRSCANSRGPRTEEFKKTVSQKMTGVLPWNVGKQLSDEHRKKIAQSLTGLTGISKSKIKNEDVFIENSSYARHLIKKRIIEHKLIEYKCECCGQIDIWNNKKISLQLDHINGVNDDHRLQNLRFLCPNCHSQQDTYASKNRKNPNRKPKKYV
jgi:5-methylcytosine-specific restriction endonuclease McrA